MRRLLSAVIFSLLTQPATAQVIQVHAGSSSLFGAHGGSATVDGQTYSSTLGAGVLDGTFVVGFLARKSIRRVSLTIGDEAVDFQLPTDLFGGSRYVPVRAAGAEWTHGTTSLRVIGGTTSDALGAPFFRGATSSQPLGLLFYDQRLSSRWHVFSRTAFSRRQTSIHGFSFRPTSYFNAAVAAGVGNDKAYVASSAALNLQRVQASAAFVQQQVGFRRLAVDSPMAAEPVRENLIVTLRPTAWWSLSGARQTLIGDVASGGNERRVEVNQVTGSLNLAGFRWTAAVYGSHQPGVRTIGTSATVSRRLTRSIDVGADYFRSDTGDPRPEHSVVLRLQESLGPRISLLQTINRTGGQTSFHAGGTFVSNPLRAAISYQTVYVPLKIGHPFVHVVGVDLQLNVLDRIRLQAATYVTPAGQLRYTVSGSVLHWASDGDLQNRNAYKFAPYVVEGSVRDSDGQPVAGAVIHLNRQVLVTDSTGRFLMRSAKAKPIKLDVSLEEFLAPGRFELVSAPAWVTPATDGHAADIVIIVRRW